ncbi:hypothetical protein ANAPC5_00732 [Anaplasma phagocytophilum]|nr:hypothetical protein ANAPC2_00090 [Anaplasma phagocytophilum]SBO30438.1 hypothetical protein ANAPC3_00206 [Anaplasma phagocytophilum]SBO32423.1 hypothetical protein ANAPC4_00806 [Anaplasma phagocytophilum]SCV63987.1 hypothetical protein ANAPC5_00732 [Anaplasma phagocytophilum]
MFYTHYGDYLMDSTALWAILSTNWDFKMQKYNCMRACYGYLQLYVFKLDNFASYMAHS